MLAGVGRVGAIGQHGRSARGIANAPTFSPATLFANSEAGAWYDPSDTSTLAQNSDGTTSVSVGDPVGYMADLSGNGNHATQSTDAARPVLRQDANGKYYLEFDGTDDVIASPADVFSASTFAELAAAWVSVVDDTANHPISFGNFEYSFRNLTDRWRWIARGVDVGATATQKQVLVGNVDFSSASPFSIQAWSNGNKGQDSTTDKPKNIVTQTVIGAKTDSGENTEAGKFYGGYFRIDNQMTTSERENLEQYLANKAGITL